MVLLQMYNFSSAAGQGGCLVVLDKVFFINVDIGMALNFLFKRLHISKSLKFSGIITTEPHTHRSDGPTTGTLLLEEEGRKQKPKK